MTINEHVNKKNVVWLDTETGGLYRKCDVHQIAGCIEIDGKVVDEFEYFLRPFPDSVVTPQALKIMGVTLRQIRKYPKPIEAYEQFVQLLSKYCNPDNPDELFVAAGHNIGFDIRKLTQFGQKVVMGVMNGFGEWSQDNVELLCNFFDKKDFDTLKLARSMRKKGALAAKRKNKLIDLAEEFNLQFGRLHDAREDIRITREVGYKLLEEKEYYKQRILEQKQKNVQMSVDSMQV